MNARSKIDMTEVTRLTREGRLGEAMAVLRGGFATDPAALADDVASRPTAPDLDFTPSQEPGGSWALAQGNEAPSAGRRGGINPTQPPGTLRGLFGQLPFKPIRLKGLVTPAAERRPLSIPDGARFEERVFANQAGSRPYKLYIPSSYHGQAMPLIVMLHGCTQSPDDFAAGTRMNELAEEHTFLVAYPAQLQSANASKCWNWFRANDQKRDSGEPSLIAGITRQVMRDFAVRRGCVYIAGLSAGGAAAAVLGSTYPELYSAIGVHSGLACGAASDLPSAYAAMRQGGSSTMRTSHRQGGSVPTIVFHGDRDMTVNPVNADQIIALSKPAMNLRTTVNQGETPGGIRYTRAVHADERGTPILEQWMLQGAGHAWSGGSAAGSYTEPRGPDASREMVRFFLQHDGQKAADRSN